MVISHGTTYLCLISQILFIFYSTGSYAASWLEGLTRAWAEQTVLNMNGHEKAVVCSYGIGWLLKSYGFTAHSMNGYGRSKCEEIIKLQKHNGGLGQFYGLQANKLI